MPYKILDLFAGAGGLSLGFEETKLFRVAAIVENNKNAAATNKFNHPGLNIYDDILKVDFKDILESIGRVDVVIGGPPCQGFSNANRQRRHLINGSNELVKRYVQAIKEIQPNVFVMENVKTIASQKQSFCVTKSDKEYIEKKLRLQTYDKDILLYDGNQKSVVYDLYRSLTNDEVARIVVLKEEQIYLIYNILKKCNRLKKYFAKDINIKKVKNIIDNLSQQQEFPSWLNTLTLEVKNVLNELLDSKGTIVDRNIEKLKEYWNVLRFFQGLKELNEKEASYKVVPNAQGILVRMKTYTVIDFVKKAFDNLGYETNGSVLNAASFGVPQMRERYILIGVKRKFNHLSKDEIHLPKAIIDNPNNYVTVSEAIGDLECYEPTTETMSEVINVTQKHIPITYYQKMVMKSDQDTIYNHVCTKSSATALNRFKQIKQGGNFHSLPEQFKQTYENPSRTQNTIYRRLNANQPSDTVVNVRKSMWIHPHLDRAVSAREAARLQSFPDWYQFCGTKDSVYQQIGNAVPPLLGRAVAEAVLTILGNTEDYKTLKQIYEE